MKNSIVNLQSFVVTGRGAFVNFLRHNNQRHYRIGGASANRLHHALYHAVQRGEYRLEPECSGGYFAWPQAVTK